MTRRLGYHKAMELFLDGEAVNAEARSRWAWSTAAWPTASCCPTPDYRTLDYRMMRANTDDFMSLWRCHEPVVWKIHWHEEAIRQIDEDVPIWEHKLHRTQPSLAPGDGPIMKFRRWARQFVDTQPLPAKERGDVIHG